MNRSFRIPLCSALLLVACSGSDPASLPARGARVPWTEYEAEDGVNSGGAALEQTTSGPWLEGTLSGEASGRKAVTLGSPDGSIQWTSGVEANSVVARYSVPDEKEAHLNVLVNGTQVATLAVNSDYAGYTPGPPTTRRTMPTRSTR